jgi:hypothetical protein
MACSLTHQLRGSRSYNEISRPLVDLKRNQIMNRKLAALTLSLMCGVYAGGAFAQAAPSNTTPMTSADKKAAKAQQKADEKSAEAQQEATKKSTVAQAKADKTKTEAQGDANNKKADANLSNAKDQ